MPMRVIIGSPFDVVKEYNDLEKKYGCARFRGDKGIYAVQSHVIADNGKIELYLVVYWR
jgi:hypothetical protein